MKTKLKSRLIQTKNRILYKWISLKFFKRNLDFSLYQGRILLIFVAFGLLAIFTLPFSRITGIVYLTPKDPSQLYFALGASIIGMLSIVFAFSLQLLGRASELFPTRLYRTMINDWQINITYVAVGLMGFVQIVAGYVATDLLGNNRAFVLRLSLAVLFLSVTLLFFAYQRLKTVLSHEHQVTKYSKIISRKVASTIKLIKELEEYYSKHLKANKDLAKRTAVYQIKKLEDDILDDIDIAFEMSKLYANKDDVFASNNFMTCGFATILSYVDQRKSSIIGGASPEYLFNINSDLDKFVERFSSSARQLLTLCLEKKHHLVVGDYIRYFGSLLKTSLLVDDGVLSKDSAFFQNVRFFFNDSMSLVKEKGTQDDIAVLLNVSADVITQAKSTHLTPDPVELLIKDYQDLFRAVTKDLTSSDDSLRYIAVENSLKIIRLFVSIAETQEDRLESVIKLLDTSYRIRALSNSPLMHSVVADFSNNIAPTILHSKLTLDEKVHRAMTLLEEMTKIQKGFLKISKGNSRSLMTAIYPLYDLSTLLLGIYDQLDDDQLKAQVIHSIRSTLAVLNDIESSVSELESTHDLSEIVEAFIKTALVAVAENELGLAEEIAINLLDTGQKVIVQKPNKPHDLLVSLRHIIYIAERLTQKDSASSSRIMDKYNAVDGSFISTYFPDGIKPNVLYSPRPDSLAVNPYNEHSNSMYGIASIGETGINFPPAQNSADVYLQTGGTYELIRNFNSSKLKRKNTGSKSKKSRKGNKKT